MGEGQGIPDAVSCAALSAGPPEPGSLEDLLKMATVRLSSRMGRTTSRGTGFLLAPGLLVTCAHVLADGVGQLPGTVSATFPNARPDDPPLRLRTDPSWYLLTGPAGLDLAFVRVPADLKAPHVLLSEDLVIGDELWVFGYPQKERLDAEPALLVYQGPSRLRVRDAGWSPERVVGDVVYRGHSGSPVLNRRTGAVCGMLYTSNENGSAHLVPAASIMERCPLPTVLKDKAIDNRSWLDLLDDHQITRGGWRYPGPHLRAYLGAVATAARSAPVLGSDGNAAHGVTLPAVYTAQNAEPLDVLGRTVTVPDVARSMPLPAADLLDRRENCVIIGAPGAGKTSLLRTGLIAAAERWQEPGAGRAVPAYVLAADLAASGNVPEAVSARVRAELRDADWPAEFFAGEPLPGVPWLLLVDGLDEIIDPGKRRGVLRTLTDLAGPAHPSPYVFVVATRHMAGQELPHGPGWPSSPYQLLPFSSGDLSGLARRWFAELGVADPEQAAADFAAQLERDGLSDLACTPLVGTILCQLYASHPGRLPDGRFKIYQEFIAELADRQYRGDAGGIQAQIEATFGRYTPVASAAAYQELTKAPDLVTYLAACRADGDRDAAIDLLLRATKGARPAQVPERLWRAFLTAVMRRSGLLAEQGDDFAFLHPTIPEFLLAQFYTADQQARDRAFRDVFGSWSHDWPWIWRRTWRGPYPWGVYAFVVDALSDHPHLPGKLRELIRRGGLRGCRFVALLVTTGSVRDPAVRAAVKDRLASLAARRPGRFLWWRRDDMPRWIAAAELDNLGDDRGARTMSDLVSAPALSAFSQREGLSDFLIASRTIGNAHAADLLAAFATNPLASGSGREGAAAVLATCGDARGPGLLADVAADPRAGAQARWRAAMTLVSLGDPRGNELLAVMAADPQLSTGDRVTAAYSLFRNEDARGSDLMAAMATEPTLSSADRARARRFLDTMKDPRARQLEVADLTARIADPASGFLTRMDALAGMQYLQLGPEKADGWAMLAASKDLDYSLRRHAAYRLLRAGDPRGAQLKAEADAALADARAERAADASKSFLLRRKPAAELLAESGDARGLDVLVGWATDPSMSARHRRWAVQSIAGIGGAPCADRLAELAVCALATEAVRDEAIRALEKLGDPRATPLRADLLAALGADRTLPADDRVSIALRLHRLGDPSGLNLLAAIAAEPPETSGPADGRRKAARKLAELGDSRGTALLTDQVADAHLEGRDRMRAARTLAWLRDTGGHEALARLASADETSEFATAALEDFRGPSLMARTLAVLAGAGPLLVGFLIGGALASAAASRPGPGNWAALAVTLVLVLAAFVCAGVTLIASWEPVSRLDGVDVGMRAVVITLFLPVLAGALGAGAVHLLPSSWHTVTRVVWNLLLWR